VAVARVQRLSLSAIGTPAKRPRVSQRPIAARSRRPVLRAVSGHHEVETTVHVGFARTV